jgi:hypothetical protein
MMLGGGFFSTGDATPPSKPPQVQIGLAIGKAKISGGETTTGQIVVRRNGNTQELTLRLENNNPSLVQLSTSEITLKPAESSASFDTSTSATPISAALDRVLVQKTVEIVPAMLKAVTLSQPTLNGTQGSKITCRLN